MSRPNTAACIFFLLVKNVPNDLQVKGFITLTIIIYLGQFGEGLLRIVLEKRGAVVSLEHY